MTEPDSAARGCQQQAGGPACLGLVGLRTEQVPWDLWSHGSSYRGLSHYYSILDLSISHKKKITTWVLTDGPYIVVFEFSTLHNDFISWQILYYERQKSYSSVRSKGQSGQGRETLIIWLFRPLFKLVTENQFRLTDAEVSADFQLKIHMQYFLFNVIDQWETSVTVGQKLCRSCES